MPQAEKIEDSKCPESIWDKWEKEELKVEDSGSEADFGTKDNQERWEEKHEYYSTPDMQGRLMWIVCNMIDNPVDCGIFKTTKCIDLIKDYFKSLLEAERAKVIQEIIEWADKENWHYADFEKLKAKYKGEQNENRQRV